MLELESGMFWSGMVPLAVQRGCCSTHHEELHVEVNAAQGEQKPANRHFITSRGEHLWTFSTIQEESALPS